MATLKSGTTAGGSIVLTDAIHNNTGNPHPQYTLTADLMTTYYNRTQVDSLLAQNSIDDTAANAGYAAAAEQSAIDSQNSADASALSASQAATSATNAGISAGEAAISEANAAASELATANLYDQFDDRYLGDKASDPTLDNDGDALLTGALYFNTTDTTMRVYDGATWINIQLTAARILQELLTVDGAGSGLDSDLLDGQEGSYYLDRTNHTGTQTLSTISDAGTIATYDDTDFVSQDSGVGAAQLPTGTIADRPSVPVEGMFRRNSETGAFEGYDGESWTGVGGVPTGGIIMWSGAIVNIPDGWAICNGSNGTPDLRNRFIVGAGSTYAVGNTGGANSVALTVGQLPAHNHGGSTGNSAPSTSSSGSHSHSGSTNSTGSHTHVLRTRTSGNASESTINRSADSGIFATGSGAINSAGSHSHSLNIDSSGGHTHTVNNHSHSISSQGSGQSHENRPPYYALAYIMKL